MVICYYYESRRVVGIPLLDIIGTQLWVVCQMGYVVLKRINELAGILKMICADLTSLNFQIHENNRSPAI